MLAHIMRILLATEGGERGTKDLRLLNSITSAGGHDIDIAYVQEVEDEMPSKHYEIAKETQKKKGVAEPGAERKTVLDQMSVVADEEGMEVGRIGLKGDPAKQILKRVRKGDYDLVSLGSGGRGIFTKEILGFVANRVIKESPTSILVMKGEQEKCERVLVCTKGGAESLEVFEFAGRLLSGGDFEVTTLYVGEPFPRLQGYMETVEEDIQQVVEDFRPPGEPYIEKGVEKLKGYGLDSERKVREGDFQEQVLEEAGGGNYDLVVLGSHVLSDWFEKYWKDDRTVPIVRDLEQSFLLFRE
ncbi:MAG: hypothetical protein MAG715_00060 [Methanonatronarchaeales archaeon]|nr:hypothetical protein [Methanonatronarchaeales archaeon]